MFDDLPVTSGLVARYDAQTASTVVDDGFGNVTTWVDRSGNGYDLTIVSGNALDSGTINGLPALDFDGLNGGMVASSVPLASEVTVFAVIQYRAPGNWGPIAHHGSRDMDWSLEQNGLKGNDVTHFQSNNDNANVELSLANGTNYILAGRVTGSTRYYSATSTSTVSTSGGNGVTINPGFADLYVGRSDAGEVANAVIGELVYYNRSLTNGERDAVIAYLQKRWGFHGPALFSDDFGGLNGAQQTGNQCTTNKPVYGTAALPAWTVSGGIHPIHGINMNGASDYAVQFHDANTMIMNTGVAANTTGTTYTVGFRGGPTTWADCGQGTAAGEVVRFEVVRANGTTLATFDYVPGAWNNAQTLTPTSFSYAGDGSGLVRLRITDVTPNSKFAGAVDDLAIYGP